MYSDEDTQPLSDLVEEVVENLNDTEEVDEGDDVDENVPETEVDATDGVVGTLEDDELEDEEPEVTEE